MTDGVFTNDGCSVEVYRRLPAAGEPEIVHAAVPGGAVVLDLGHAAQVQSTHTVGSSRPHALARCRQRE